MEVPSPKQGYQEADARYWGALKRGEYPYVSGFTNVSLPFNLAEPIGASTPGSEGPFPWLRYVGLNLLDDYPVSDRVEDSPGKPWSELSLNFDLTMPLEPQLSQASGYLRSWRPGSLEAVVGAGTGDGVSLAHAGSSGGGGSGIGWGIVGHPLLVTSVGSFDIFPSSSSR